MTRKGLAAEWTAWNGVLANNELGIEIDPGSQIRGKKGDGTTVWNSLPYVDLAKDNLPSYVTSRIRSNFYNQINNVYNWKTSNTRKLHASLARAAAGFLTHHVVLGDSLSAGYMGDGASPIWEPTKAWPVVYRKMLSGLGVPTAGTGFVPISDVTQVAADSRWSTTGTWTATGLGYASTATNGATATFIPDIAGVQVDVYYYGGGGAATVNVNGAGAVSLDMTGGIVIKKYTLTGTFPAGTQVVITASNTTLRYIVGVAVRAATGLVVHNLGEGSSRTATWTPTTAGTLNDSRCGALVLSSITPAAVFCELGVNDYLNGVSGTTFKANLTTLRNQYSTSDFILVGPPTWNLLSDEMFDLADTLDIPFIDTFSRYGGIGSGQPGQVNGLVTDSSFIHPNQACHADWGRSIAALASGGASAAPDPGPASVGVNWSPSAYVAGNYFLCNGWQWTSVYGGNTAYNNLPVASPWIVTDTITLAKLFTQFTIAGEANSKFRIGIWNHNPATGLPGTIFFDGGSISTGSGNAGDVATGGTPGVYERTISKVVPAGLYWIGGVIQGSPTTAPTMLASQIDVPHLQMPLGTSLPAASTTSGMVFSFTTMSGAIADFPTAVAPINLCPRIGFKIT